MPLRFLPTASTLAVLACVCVAVALAGGPRVDTRVAQPGDRVAESDAPRATPAARGIESPAVSIEATPTPEPAGEATPQATTTEPTAAPPKPTPPLAPVITRPPAPRTAPPPPPPPRGGLGIGGRVTDQFGAGYGGVCVTIGPPIRCATTTAGDGTYFVSLESAPLGLGWDVRFLLGGAVKAERPGIVVSGPVVVNVSVPR